MKFRTSALLLALCLCLSACGGAPAEEPRGLDGAAAKTLEGEEPSGGAETPPPPGSGGGSLPSLAEDEEPAVVTCRVVDGAEDGNLLLAELDGGLYGGTGVYRLNLGTGGPRATIMYGDRPAGKSQPTAVPVYLDGEPAEASVLEDGMAVDVAFNGFVAESFPAQFGEAYSVSAWSRGRGRNPMGTEYDLCGLYLQVLDDLWRKDPGLNEDISQVALDLSRAPGELTEGEKLALVHRFGELHGVEAFAATFEELKEQGYLTFEPLGDGAPEGAAFVHWEDGCFFSIEPNEGHEEEVYSLPVIFFNGSKWRSSLGAYCLYDCSAMWAEGGTWTGYQTGSEMIS